MEEVGFLVQPTGRPYLALQLPEDSCDGTTVLQDLGCLCHSQVCWESFPKALSSVSHS